ncbi:hypothetical protein AGABI1DRAFT_134752 [Agaricus bisporus var. burnettii JB137-S8]|uniref:Uncharacterized protein n=1 Tax=Agaricus bisporus var. burnettii (strain JB137-S8 / ATCC MYA-4627 / FGSC 10392) TaxID=597362 RepID=K5WDW4_AGABU|nr:uncharacterized protein AGABI1DRAFT_134752 [Agaricus bisporus var. burnettii JB137-S8]EKM73446.1 hypothetical protein AGABI1DRAFT_134752 [Agaricus bisporus var. burnettii JB137-S8]
MTRSPYFSSPVLNYSTSPYPADEVEAIKTEKEKERRESSNLNSTVEEGLIDPLYVSTHEQVADILTKAVAKKVVEFAVPLLGLE